MLSLLTENERNYNLFVIYNLEFGNYSLEVNMKVALIHDYLNQIGGAEKVLMTLHELYPKSPIYTLFYDKKKLKGAFDNLDIITSPTIPKFLIKRHKYLLPFLPQGIEQFNLSDFDIVISSSNAYAKGVITQSKTVHICYCHAPMRFVWDWHSKYLKEQKIGKIKKIFVIPILNYIRLWDKISSGRPDYFIANSKNTQKRIKKYYGKNSKVIYPPVDVKRFKTSKNNENYFLIVSRLSPYKNIEIAIKAFNKLKLRLVIIGKGSQEKYLQKIAEDNIDFLGFQSDEAISEYYQNCRAFVFPTFDEDFGITPVEAMASGKPVIAAGRGGTQESIIEGITGEFFKDNTPESLIFAVNKFIMNEKKYNLFEIRKQAEKFSKEKFKENIQNFVNWAKEDYKEKIV